SEKYLTLLQRRTKWQSSSSSIQSGTFVLMAKDNTPPGQWFLDRGHKEHPGGDGVVRVLKTKTGFFMRVHKLCPLPLE
ncbi:hypothetical protein KR009_008106, partial [Drosophila setifemur]